MKKDPFDYYIFMDDDLKLYFSLKTFEKLLEANQALWTAAFVLHPWYCNPQGLSEEVKYIEHCFMAVKQDCVLEVLLYSLELDKINLWLTCERMCEKF